MRQKHISLISKRRTNKYWQKFLIYRKRIFLLLLACIFLIEELNLAFFQNIYHNFYTSTSILRIHASRKDFYKNKGNSSSTWNIAILTVIKNKDNYEEYRLAQETLECYAIYHGYKWIVIDLSLNSTLRGLCPQKDFMFTRHCVTAYVLQETNIDWLLFVDADMGVINPNRLIEEWIDDSVDMIFYNRIFNYEIMAGSYLVKNTNYSKQFLLFWANYEYKLPNSFHGTDNGAIQNVFLELLFPKNEKERLQCESWWNRSRNFDGLYIYEACARSIMGSTMKWPGKVKILPKGTSWARDTWLTNSMWSQKDFIFHGWQKRKINGVMFAAWYSPFSSTKVNLSICSTSKAGINWNYKNSFIRNEEEIDAKIQKWVNKVSQSYHRTLEILNSIS